LLNSGTAILRILLCGRILFLKRLHSAVDKDWSITSREVMEFHLNLYVKFFVSDDRCYGMTDQRELLSVTTDEMQ